jgi:hypothetical protein
MFATTVLGLKLLVATSERIGRKLFGLAFCGAASMVKVFVDSVFSFVFITTPWFKKAFVTRLIEPSVLRERVKGFKR